MYWKKKRSGILPDCSKCPPNGFIIPIPENYEIVEFISMYSSSLVDGMGGINMNAIISLLDIAGIEVSEKNVVKVTSFILSGIQTRNEPEQNHSDDINNLINGDIKDGT